MVGYKEIDNKIEVWGAVANPTLYGLFVFVIIYDVHLTAPAGQ